MCTQYRSTHCIRIRCEDEHVKMNTLNYTVLPVIKKKIVSMPQGFCAPSPMVSGQTTLIGSLNHPPQFLVSVIK